MKKLVLLLSLLCVPATAFAQSSPYVIVLEGPLTSSASCTVQRNAGDTAWVCTAPAAASQPLTDSSGLIADNIDPTKVLFFQLSGLTTATNRTWTIPDANITIPSTIASLAANTFTGLQTLNAGIAATTGTFSSTLGVTGAFTGTTGTFSSTLGVTGAFTGTSGAFSTTLGVTGAFTGTSGAFSTTLGVTGAVTFSSTANTAVNIAGALNVGGQSSSIAAGDISAARSTTSGYINLGTDGSVYFGRSGSVVTLGGGTMKLSAYSAGTLVTDGSGNVTASSDERLKDITGQFGVGLNAVLGLQPILHKWKPETGYDTENTYASFSAQNVQRFIPEAVGVGLDGMLTVNDRPVLLAVVNAVKELTDEIDTLRAAANLPVIRRGMQPVMGDARSIKSATPARLAEVAEAEKTKIEQAKQESRRAIRAALEQCRADNKVIREQGGTPVVCAKTRDEKDAAAELMKEQEAAELAAQKVREKEIAQCERLNKKIAAAGGKPRVCGSTAPLTEEKRIQ